jgi:DivIVA domain-containing protein
VALERQSIEKKDFPIGRRGYDPEAVDAHLSALADEVDELKRSSRRRVETLASSASEQVRAIVEAAESSAADIQRQAEEDAQEIRAEANAEARSTREQATAQAREYVGKVSESTSTMLERLDAMESELGALTEALRTGGNRLNADLQLLEGNLTEVSDAVSPPRFEPEASTGSATSAAAEPEAPVDKSPVYEATPEPAVEDAPAASAEPETLAEVSAPVDASAAAEMEEYGQQAESHAPADSPAAADTAEQPEAGGGGSADTAEQPEAGGGGSDDTEGARLIALNMALNGTPREETERYLAENFSLADRTGLLDEVYASVDG